MYHAPNAKWEIVVALIFIGSLFLVAYIGQTSGRVVGNRCGRGVDEEEWRIFTWQFDEKKGDLVCRDGFGLKPYYHSGWRRDRVPLSPPE